MKSFMLAALVVLAVLRPAESGLLPSDAPGNGTFNLNSIFDGVLEKLRNRLRDLGSLPLPDRNILNKVVQDGLVGITAQVDLRNGQLKNLMNMNRGGNVCLEINDTVYTVKANINFSGLEIHYYIVSRLPYISTIVHVPATVMDFVVRVKVEADYSKMKLKLKALDVLKRSDALVGMWSPGLLGPEDSTFREMVYGFFQEEVGKTIATKARDEVVKMVESLDLTTLIG